MKFKKYKNNKIFICIILLCAITISIATYTLTYSEYTTTTTLTDDDNASGVFDNVVIVDDLASDYNYYMGLNYTNSSDGSLPSMVNQNIYNDDNLVKVTINYKGTSIDGNLTGYVSLDRKQDTYTYYKYYPKEDGYISILLIDNPFTDRPTDMAFNGWITDYQGASVSFDATYYERYVKVPVTSNEVTINMYASWVTASVGNITSSSSSAWSSAFSALNSEGMETADGKQVAIHEDVTGLYISGTVSNRSSYPSGAVDSSGNSLTGTCRAYGRPGSTATCTYYMLVTENTYDESASYYKLTTYSGWGNYSYMESYTPEVTGYETVGGFNEGELVAGYYKKITINRNESYAGYYNSTGEYQESGTCTSYSGCEYYELIQYYDDYGNVNIYDDSNSYYYLVTRDTNIIVLKTSISNVPSSSYTKPYTLTSIYNGTDYTSSATLTVSSTAYKAYNDMVLENIKINSGSSNSNNGPASNGYGYGSSNTNISGFFYGNYHNVKIGIGIVQNGSYKTFNAVIAGDSSTSSLGNSNNTTKYKLIIESGYYNSLSLANGYFSSSNNKYLEARAIYGNDYDRVSKDNSNLDIYFCAASSWGDGNYYSSSTTTGLGFDTVIKSGKFGSGKYDNATGVYVGGRGYGDHYTAKRTKVEGGWIYNLIGGPTAGDNRSEINDVYIYITGGEVDMVVGGAGTSTTYGNRIIQVTGGTVNYSVFGGSNGYNGSSSDGKLSGSSLVYIGGIAVIGSSDNVNNANKLWGAEAGSVFGIGNGKSGTSSIGSNDNSNVIIDGKATILNNVYGGGNYGATGVNSDDDTNTTNIYIKGGTVKGNIYGGGNNNGAGKDSANFKVNIEMTGGTVEGSIFGGSRTTGTVYGDVSLNLLAGTIKTSIYGGGEGGYTSSSDVGTFVTGDINVIVGEENGSNEIKVVNSVYGGSAFGTVNGSTNSSSVSSKNTYVKVYSGEINNVFGGGEGNDTYTPYVLGNTTVDINGGVITNVFGGNDLKGTPNGSVTVNINGGVITNAYAGGNQTEVTSPYINIYGGSTTNAYGGGNQAKVDISNVLLEGGTVTNLFGGSNASGDVTTSNVKATSGTATNIYGGNNIGGTTQTTNVTIDGGDIENTYGGGKETDVTTATNVTLNAKVTNLFGGSDTKGEVKTSYININDGIASNIYGGNNLGGTTITSNISIEGGILDYVYGGGLEASTTTSNINLIYGKINNLFGGGKSAGVDTTHINLNKGYVKNTYGGSNTLGDVDSSNIKNISNELESNSSLYVDTTFTTSTINTTGATNISSSETLSVTINNNLGVELTEWDLYLITTDTIFDSNWSGTTVEEINGVIHADEVNQWYGTNTIKSGSTHTFSFNVHSYVSYDDFKICGYVMIGRDSSGNTYKTVVYNDLYLTNLYGGNNEGGITNSSNILLTKGDVDTAYGGGKKADVTKTNIVINGATIEKAIYGGGDQALVSTNTNLEILGSSIVKGDAYGGGNEAKVEGNTKVYLKEGTVQGNIYGGGNNGAVLGEAYTYISSGIVGESAHAGGNGSTAIVLGGNRIDVDGNSNITKHLFGGGNAAETGCEDEIDLGNEKIACSSPNTATSEVNIAGATILGNVYGGANTSVVYGETYVNIGIDTISSDYNLIKDNINIVGTVFGGGEANASGSEDYDFKFISVTKGININIDANNHDTYLISGSIFGSGNASSSGGYSYVNINNYGTSNDYKTNISIQRADIVTLDNSAIELTGATDRTNKYKNELFTFSRIKHLKLKNGSTLYLNQGTNLLEKYSSLVDIDGKEVEVEVNIDKDKGSVSNNGKNYIYMLEGKNMNISDDESLATYGDVNGMTFFGMFTKDRTGKIATAMYSPEYDYGDKVSSSELYYFSSGSYVVGKHKDNHNYYKDGFYTNYASEDGTSITVDYIEPTPSDTIYYRWVVGEAVEVIELSLTASKYSTLGTYELQLLNYYQPNTEFLVLGVNYDNLSSDINLLASDDIPRYATSVEDANSNFGLAMKTGSNGWITKGDTEFITDKGNELKGTTTYKSENSSTIPSLIFYLYHSKNLNISKNLGSVTISLMVVTPIDDLNNKIERVNVLVNLSSALYDGDNYEASITSGAQYEMFANSNVHITNKSSFSTYFSLYKESDTTPYKTGYYRSLVSSYALPVNTKITMIDFGSSDKPEYYYYVISKEDYEESLVELNTEGEIGYLFSKFIKMGSSSEDNTYKDSSANVKYYDSSNKKAEEEFIFIVDLKDTSIDTDVLKQNLLMELRDSNDNPIIPVLDIAQQKMQYNLYSNKDAVINATSSLSSDTVYMGSSTDLTVITDFAQQKINGINIIDTNFYDKKLGVRLALYDSDNNLVNGATLLGTKFIYDGVTYYPRQDGTVRFNIAETIANVSSKITIDTTNSNIPSGDYVLKIEAFASADGIYYGLTPSEAIEENITFVNEVFGLSATMSDEDTIIDKTSGLGKDSNNQLSFMLEYDSNLKKPSIHISLYRRTYDDIYNYSYSKVDLKDYVTDELTSTSVDKEYLVVDSPNSKFQYILNMKENLVSGTYQVKFSLYDKNTYVGEISKYIIIK